MCSGSMFISTLWICVTMSNGISVTELAVVLRHSVCKCVCLSSSEMCQNVSVDLSLYLSLIVIRVYGDGIVSVPVCQSGYLHFHWPFCFKCACGAPHLLHACVQHVGANSVSLKISTYGCFSSRRAIYLPAVH